MFAAATDAAAALRRPLSSANGAKPNKAAAWRPSSWPNSSMSAHKLAALTGPIPGIERTSSTRRAKLASAALHGLDQWFQGR